MEYAEFLIQEILSSKRGQTKKYFDQSLERMFR